MNAIRTRNLTKRYGDVTAIEELDLEVGAGEVFGFLGPNGAGKSTTINLLLDFVRPSEGGIEVLGHDAQAESEAIRPRIGVLPEGFDVYERLSGRRHVEFAVETKDAADDPDAILERVGLSTDDAARPAGGYSKGMRQRLALGMALVGDPDLLIMDEPTSGLDPTGIREVQQIVREEAERGTTVFFSSHILEHVEAVCDRVGVLYDGSLAAVDTIANLKQSLGCGSTVTMDVDDASATVQETVAAVEGVADVTAEEGRLEVTCAEPAAKAAAIAAAQDTAATVTDVSIEDVSLEELYTLLTEADEQPAGDDATPQEVVT